jgi:hypothetical protein
MSEDRVAIDKIIRAWKSEYGVNRTGEKGSAYKIMSPSDLQENFRILARTLMDAGYTYEEIDDPHVSVKIADICWREDKIIKMSTAAVRAAKISFATDWNDVISDKEFSGIKMSKVERKAPKKADVKEHVPTDPNNIIIPDPALYFDTPQDLEFLALIGVDPEGDK